MKGKETNPCFLFRHGLSPLVLRASALARGEGAAGSLSGRPPRRPLTSLETYPTLAPRHGQPAAGEIVVGGQHDQDPEPEETTHDEKLGQPRGMKDVHEEKDDQRRFDQRDRER